MAPKAARAPNRDPRATAASAASAVAPGAKTGTTPASSSRCLPSWRQCHIFSAKISRHMTYIMLHVMHLHHLHCLSGCMSCKHVCFARSRLPLTLPLAVSGACVPAWDGNVAECRYHGMHSFQTPLRMRRGKVKKEAPVEPASMEEDGYDEDEGDDGDERGAARKSMFDMRQYYPMRLPLRPPGSAPDLADEEGGGEAGPSVLDAMPVRPVSISGSAVLALHNA